MNITRTFSLDLQAAQIVEAQDNASSWLRFLIKNRGMDAADLMEARRAAEMWRWVSQRLAELTKEDLAAHVSHVKAVQRDIDGMKNKPTGLEEWGLYMEKQQKEE